MAVPHKTQLSRSRVKLDLLLMVLRQSEFSGGVPTFNYISADASPQGSLEFYVILEDRISRGRAAEIVEATSQELDEWCKSGYLQTTTFPISILGSGKATAAAKFEALTHAVVLDTMQDGDPSHVAKYASSIISFCSDYGAEANLASLPNVCVQDILKSNVNHSGGLLAINRDVAEQRFEPLDQDEGGIIEDCMVVEDTVVFDPPPTPEQKCFFGMASSMMIPGVKHMFDNVHKELLESLQYYAQFQETCHVFSPPAR